MIGIVICTHATLATALLEAGEMIVGPIENATAVTVNPGESGEDIVDKLSEAIESVDQGDGVIVLCDMFGGTPSNVSLTLLSDKIEVITGVNLPMLLKLYTCRTRPFSEATELAQKHGRENILVAGALLRPKGEDA